MVIAFLLAQLVLPGPPSSSIQPPGMICVSGSCEMGPMVYRTSASRSRLVVACDMRSDTCSDGRRITTVRATPVPCETSPGVWEMVPENTSCYSVRGLESWAPNTSYLAYGAELGRSPWSSGGAPGHVVRVYDVEGVNRMCQEAPLSPTSPAGRYQFPPVPTEAGTNTLSCIARPNTGSNIRLIAGDISHIAIFPMVPGWARYTHSTEVEEGHRSQISVYTLGQTCIDIAGCWLTRTSTPGRACWGGEAPVTCAADRHTISTEGWPTESGEISFAFQLDEAPSGTTSTYQYILDSRVAEESSTFFAVRGDGRFFVGGGVPSASPVTWVAGQTYAIRVRAEGGVVRVWRNGVLIHEAAGGFVWGGATARLGARFTNTQQLNGSISSLTVRSYEEVSP